MSEELNAIFDNEVKYKCVFDTIIMYSVIFD